jgi:S-formylglutathione hydrolase FrmB
VVVSLLLCLGAIVQTAGGQVRLVDDSLSASSTGSVWHVRVALPAPLPQGTRVPVLFLLHGFGGNERNWSELAPAGECAWKDTVCIIMPEGRNSWYVNAADGSAGQFEDFFVRDLLPWVYRHYSVDSARVGIAGLSMGGYGALILGLRHAGLFSFVGALSGALDIPFGIPFLDQGRRAALRESLVKAFGADSSRWAGYDPWHILATLPADAGPYLYLATGIQDELPLRLRLHRQLADTLHARGWRYEFHETPGRHSWEYWSRELPPLINRFRATPRPPPVGLHTLRGG